MIVNISLTCSKGIERLKTLTLLSISVPPPTYIYTSYRLQFFSTPNTHSLTSPPPSLYLTLSPLLSSPPPSFPPGVIWTIWRTRHGRRASTTSTASSRRSSSPSRRRQRLGTATASSPTSVRWAPYCYCCKPSWAQWSTPSW